MVSIAKVQICNTVVNSHYQQCSKLNISKQMRKPKGSNV